MMVQMMDQLAEMYQRQQETKIKLVQRQLVMLLHAHKCLVREKRVRQTSAAQFTCVFSQCHLVKNIVCHMIDCNQGDSCTFPHCANCSKLMAHWRNCLRLDCPICGPLLRANRHRTRLRLMQYLNRRSEHSTNNN